MLAVLAPCCFSVTATATAAMQLQLTEENDMQYDASAIFQALDIKDRCLLIFPRLLASLVLAACVFALVAVVSLLVLAA